MDKKGNSAADRDQLPPITLFGKRMKLTGTASEPPPGPARHIRARRGSEDAEGRRVFWVAVGVFALVLLAALLGPRFLHQPRLLHQKDGIRVGPPVDSPVDGPVDGLTQPLAETAAPQPEASEAEASEGAAPLPPQPAATAIAPEDTSADSAPALVPPATDEAKPGGGEPARAQAGSTTTSSAPAEVRAVGRPAQGKTQAPRRPPRDEAYIRRLRERMQQYEREKAQGKSQESPQ